MNFTKALSALVFAVFIYTAPTTSFAQQAPTSLCEQGGAFNDFDFWLGKWRVTDQATGNFVGNNSIVKMDAGCFLFESWQSINGGTGHSMNYYNPVTDKWRQVWVAQGAYAIDIEGSLTNGSMVLEGSIWYYGANNSFAFRGTWTPNDNGTVRQFFEQFDPDNKKWNVWFDGLYSPSQLP